MAALLAAAPVPAQTVAPRPEPRYVAGGGADQAEGERVLREFRRMRIADTYWLGFKLTVLPRKGAERTIEGSLLGTRGDAGPVSRLTIGTQAGDERWLVVSGPSPAAWTAVNGAVRELTPAETLAPLAGTDLTLFDLQMPFLYWPDFVYEGLARVRGRPAHRLLLYPPATGPAAAPGVAGVRVFLDTQFHALVQAEMLGADGAVLKSLTVLELKKAGERWLVKSIDLRNHRTRDKTRFSVGAAALGLELPPRTFAPEDLGGDLPVIPAAAIVRF